MEDLAVSDPRDAFLIMMNERIGNIETTLNNFSSKIDELLSFSRPLFYNRFELTLSSYSKTMSHCIQEEEAEHIIQSFESLNNIPGNPTFQVEVEKPTDTRLLIIKTNLPINLNVFRSIINSFYYTTERIRRKIYIGSVLPILQPNINPAMKST